MLPAPAEVIMPLGWMTTASRDSSLLRSLAVPNLSNTAGVRGLAVEELELSGPGFSGPGLSPGLPVTPELSELEFAEAVLEES